MTSPLRRDIHAVLLPGFSGTAVPHWVAEAEDLGGVLLFGQNTPDLETTVGLTQALRAAQPGLLVAIDEEGGNVSRLQAQEGSDLPAPAALGAIDDAALTEACAHAMGDLIAACGIDLTFAPVLDVAARPDNPVIGPRSFGADPALVARHGRAVIRGLRAAGVLSGGKHFPGHGDTDVDSHLALPRLDVTDAELSARDLPPFVEAFAERMDTLMVGHLIVPAWDPHSPASLSAVAIDRARALGFTGPVVTDALDMKAVSADGVGAAAVRALAAGADLLCLGSTAEVPDDAAHFFHVRDTIEDAVRAGELDAGRIREAAERVRMLRSRSGRPVPDLQRVRARVETLGLEAARRGLRVHGDVGLRAGDVVVDLITRWDQAAGATSGPVVRELTNVLGLTPLSAADVPRVMAGARLAVVARESDGRLLRLLADYPDAVLMHVGVEGAAPDHPHIVYTHGIARASARAAAIACGSSRRLRTGDVQEDT
ncbi:glycoside hydrolase family 3 protein [Ruania alkalisoli]|uniref:Glycoside hydrolase family 3 protein n=1 Tax=Ruania alkalisoli TaxID=2779775 RepID=A0A7M1SWV0_9MICO|nr:glycoside hydrolase family 3 protein [Ruania alkalisoli]QOR71971.1 glycoside hydrolase family 3 protein [Ruania alkalisoli]